MKLIRMLLAAAAVATIATSPVMAEGLNLEPVAVKDSPYFKRAQYGATYHAVNSFGVWFWSARSAQHAVALCQMATPVGGTCWYQGYW